MPQDTLLNPNQWFTSTVRALKEHVNEAFAVEMGVAAVTVVFGHPGAAELAELLPEPQPVISFETDDITTTNVGFGDDVVKSTVLMLDPDGNPATLNDFWMIHEEGKRHVLNFDIGVWCSDYAGGYTACMRVYEVLQKILGTSRSRDTFNKASNGVSILSFSGGRIVVDKVNDIRVYRLIDAEMNVRVFSRNVNLPGDEREVAKIVQAPGLKIDSLTLNG